MLPLFGNKKNLNLDYYIGAGCGNRFHKFFVSHNSFYRVQRRYMFRQVGSKIIANAGNSLKTQESNILFRQYATHRAHTPIPTSSSREGLANNPPVSISTKKGSIVVQHTEWSLQKCNTEKCFDKVCPSLCSDPETPEKSIAHFTHSEEQSNFELAKRNLDDKKRVQYACVYTEPHETTSISQNLGKDRLRTNKLKEILQENNEK